MNNVERILIEAKSKINTPERWTQGALSRDIEGIALRSFPGKAAPKSAVCFCSLGAIYETTSNDYDWDDAVYKAVLILLNVVVSEFESIANWNDAPGRTHAEVMSVFDKAIELAGKSK